MIWARQSIFVTTSTNVAQNVDLLELFRGEMGITSNLPGTTIRRIRGALQVSPPSPVTSAQTGLLVGITRGTLAPPAAAETPADLPNADYMLFDFVAQSTSGTEGLYSRTIDVKSQRRLDEPQETLWLQLQNTLTSEGSDQVVFGWLSILLALA